jgi:hypothetical protein
MIETAGMGTAVEAGGGEGGGYKSISFLWVYPTAEPSLFSVAIEQCPPPPLELYIGLYSGNNL